MKLFFICVCFVFALLSVGDAKDYNFTFLQPCSVKDSKCVVSQWAQSVQHLSHGREDLDIPALDPLKIQNIHVDAPGLVTARFDGIVKGFKKCVFENTKTSWKKGSFKVELDLKCDIDIKGHYDLNVNGSVLMGLTNDHPIIGKGDGGVNIKNLKMKFILRFNIVKDENGVVKFYLKEGPFAYRYNISGPVTFSGDNIRVGEEDISKQVIAFVNQNWSFVMEAFGKSFFDKAMEIVGTFIRNFFKLMATTEFATEDFSAFAV